jgi:CRP-like cAMP-binding protein
LDNVFLRSLSAADTELLVPHLRTVELKQRATIYEQAEQIQSAYFPHSGIISLVVALSDGDLVEAGMVGFDGVLGISAALDGPHSLNRAIVQSPGTASVVDIDVLRGAAEQSSTLRRKLFQYHLVMWSEAQQSAACNAKHVVHSRLCRWLLRSRFLIRSDTLHLTQEFIAQMLGVRRTSVTFFAGQLQEAGIIKHRRGLIEIINLEALQDSSCECYEAIVAQRQLVLGQN